METTIEIDPKLNEEEKDVSEKVQKLLTELDKIIDNYVLVGNTIASRDNIIIKLKGKEKHIIVNLIASTEQKEDVKEIVLKTMDFYKFREKHKLYHKLMRYSCWLVIATSLGYINYIAFTGKDASSYAIPFMLFIFSLLTLIYSVKKRNI